MGAGIVVPPAASKEKLIAYLLGDEVPPTVDHPIHAWRNGLIGLIQEYWSGIEAQLKCPAKELGPPVKEGEPAKPDPSNPKAPLACYRCPDTRVIACVVDNERHEQLIQLHSKTPDKEEKDQEMATLGMLSIETCPRTLDQMKAAENGEGLKRYQLRKVWDSLGAEGCVDSSEAAKVAFINSTVEPMMQIVVDGLKVYDARHGGTPMAATPAPIIAAPAPTPVTSATAVEAVPKPTPVVKGKKTASEPSGDTNLAEALLATLKAQGEALVNLKGQVAQMELLGVEAAAKRHAELLSVLMGLDGTIKLALGAVMWEIEQKMGVPPAEVLKEAEGYVVLIEGSRVFASEGKAG
jgi:hypothetical protein